MPGCVIRIGSTCTEFIPHCSKQNLCVSVFKLVLNFRRLREKYEKEIVDLETTEKEAKSRYCQTKTKLLETEDSVINLKASVKQLEGQLEESRQVEYSLFDAFLLENIRFIYVQLSEKMSAEKSKLKELVREEMRQEVLSMQTELNQLKQSKDEEMQRVYAR